MRKLLGVTLLGLGMSMSAVAADVDTLIKQLRDDDADTRRAAAQSLGEAGAEGKPAARALMGALRDRDMFVRRFAALALGEIGADPKDAVPALRTALNDSRKEVQEAAATALGKMGKNAVNALAVAVKDEDREPEVRRKAAEALGSMGGDARPAMKSLVEALKTEPGTGGGKKRANPSDIRVEVVTALGNIASPDDKEAVDAINALTDKKNRNRSLQAAAREALKKIKTNM
jgi:HEAT repeat protein